MGREETRPKTGREKGAREAGALANGSASDGPASNTKTQHSTEDRLWHAEEATAHDRDRIDISTGLHHIPYNSTNMSKAVAASAQMVR